MSETKTFYVIQLEESKQFLLNSNRGGITHLLSKARLYSDKSSAEHKANQINFDGEHSKVITIEATFKIIEEK